jgi:hypothetical protein
VRRWTIPIVIAGCLLALLCACYGNVLLRGRQFGYRDAAHFYYPLYQRVQDEWNAGRWPLWEPEENGGMPLLGNPTAAVLYPGKIVYAVLPYPWAARLYVVAHTLLALAGMFVLLRSWGTDPTGSALAAFSYAFGLPVLFQYCNVIFLVGAAWLPLGFHAVDRWLRRGRRWGLIELAIVLAMQTLGGDPEAAFVLGLCAGGYALGLNLALSNSTPGRAPRRWPPWWAIALALVSAFVVWTVATLVLAARLPAFRPPHAPGKPALALPWMAWVPVGVLVLWGLVGLFLLNRWRRAGWRSRLGTKLTGLIAAAVLAAALGAVQLFPVLEFTRQSGRAAGEGPHDIYPFSLEPIRLAELLWPNVFGTYFQGNRNWLCLMPPVPHQSEVWIPSLYVGSLVLLLALGTLGLRGGPPWRGWLSAILVISLLASLGEYTSPLWWARGFSWLVPRLGPRDPVDATTIRLDGYLRDGDGSFYWFLAQSLPGFRQFRYPSKLLTFTALALSGLAGLGWDRLVKGEGPARRVGRLSAGLLALSVLALVGTLAAHDRLLQAWKAAEARGGRSPFGPLDLPGAYQEVCLALVQATVVLAAGLVLVRWCRRAPVRAGVLLLIATAADLALANARYVFTVPQKVMEARPKILQVIEEAERREPGPPGPYRIHRMPIWEPLGWRLGQSVHRVLDFVVWERDTLQPKYGVPYGIQYTQTLGVAELYDYEWFFGGFFRTIDGTAAAALGATPGQKVVVYPRRSFDMWNTRYFVLPAVPNRWDDEHRGFASFVFDTDPVYPRPGAFDGPGGRERSRTWFEREDVQVLRNRRAYPRAWIVHNARFIKPIKGLARTDRDAPMEEIIYANDELWHDPHRIAYDPHTLAWVDDDQRMELLRYFPGIAPRPHESVTITAYGPQRVELDAVLDVPGMVVLADIYYPGWRLTIDGVPAPIYRANRMMRGAAVGPGPHHLVYTYHWPGSVAVGWWTSLAALAVLGILAAAFTRWPVSTAAGLLPDGEPVL